MEGTATNKTEESEQTTGIFPISAPSLRFPLEFLLIYSNYFGSNSPGAESRETKQQHSDRVWNRFPNPEVRERVHVHTIEFLHYHLQHAHPDNPRNLIKLFTATSGFKEARLLASHHLEGIPLPLNNINPIFKLLMHSFN